MTDEQRKRVVARAIELLPKYGGFVSGAVNQAMLLLGYSCGVREFKELVAEVVAEVERSAASEQG